MIVYYCIRGKFHGGFIFANFVNQFLRNFLLQYMAIYSNENITKIAKFTPRELPKTVPNRKNIYAKYMVYTVINK